MNADSVSTYSALIILFGLIYIQVMLATKIGKVLGLLVGAQSLFWFLSFFCMPLYLLIASPISKIELADRRISFPSYAEGLGPVLWISALGLGVYNLVLLAYYRWRKDRPFSSPSPSSMTKVLNQIRPVAFCLYLLGWIGRIGAITGNYSLDSAFSTFATVGSSLLIISWKEKRPRPLTAFLVVLIGLEVLWAFSYTSKAALMIPLVALTMRWILKQEGARLRRRLVAVAGIACAGFLLLQPVKGISTAEQVTARASGDLAMIKGAAVSILERFDGLSAVTDAYVIPPGSWLAPQEFTERIFVGAVPKGPWQEGRASTGQSWTQEVRAYSNPGQPVSDVSLAAGPSAEGFAFAGWLGVLAENLILALITIALGHCLQSARPGLILYSSNFIFSTTLYEQGIIGVASSSNKSLQVLVVGFVLLIGFSSLSRTLGKSRYPSRHSAGQFLGPERMQSDFRLGRAPKRNLERYSSGTRKLETENA